MEEQSRDEEIKAIWANPDTRLFYKVLGAAVLIGIGLWIGRLIYAAPEANQAWGYGVNLFTGVISTAATVLILDQLAERRADRKAKAESEAEYKEQLVRDVASPSNEIAKNAVHQLRRRGWLEGEEGVLKGKDLSGANLQEAYLWNANLQGAYLRGANLQGTDLRKANLATADLHDANMQNAYLSSANLQGADLHDANMKRATFSVALLQGANLTLAELREAQFDVANLIGADLRGAKLQGTVLRWAELQGANLRGTGCNELTILPNGDPWTQTTPLQRFTDSERPDFYQPEW